MIRFWACFVLCTALRGLLEKRDEVFSFKGRERGNAPYTLLNNCILVKKANKHLVIYLTSSHSIVRKGFFPLCVLLSATLMIMYLEGKGSPG